MKIIALVGDYYHKPEAMGGALQAAAVRLGCELRLLTDPAQIPWDSLHEFRGLVFAKENRIAPAESNAVWATARHESAVAEFAANGGAVIGLHNGLSLYPEIGAIFQTMRGAFGYHPKAHPRFTVRAVSSGHPVLAGFQEFTLTDEMYFVHVEAARTTCLLELAHGDYGTSCAAWAHEVGKGRVFCFTPGHTEEVLNDPGYQGVLDKGLRWALRA